MSRQVRGSVPGVHVHEEWSEIKEWSERRKFFIAMQDVHDEEYVISEDKTWSIHDTDDIRRQETKHRFMRECLGM
jgi:hypothetical protein